MPLGGGYLTLDGSRTSSINNPEINTLCNVSFELREALGALTQRVGIIVSCPFWLHQLWRFIAPGLYPSERKFGLVFISVGSVLFLTGVTFVYTVVYPMAFKFLMGFGGGVDKPMITISEYLSFFVTTTLVFGAAFEMPLILTMLGVLGVIDYKFLKEKRRYAIVLLAALSAIVTPPDVISMLMMMGPMVLLYESSIWAVYLLGRKNK